MGKWRRQGNDYLGKKKGKGKECSTLGAYRRRSRGGEGRVSVTRLSGLRRNYPIVKDEHNQTAFRWRFPRGDVGG